MVFVTGDTHADFLRFSAKNFPEQKDMTKDDYVIICGDFGGIWDYEISSLREAYWLNWLSEKSFTLLFVDGNHENFNRLKEFPVVEFHGGKAHKIRDNVYHLMRGYVFNLCGKSFFVFGGASSHDIQDGVLYLENYPSIKDLIKDYNRRTKQGQMLRINKISWWQEELPTRYEMKRGRDNLEKLDYKVDFVITHTPPKEVCRLCGYYDVDRVISYFERLLNTGLSFKAWWSGHLHKEHYNVQGRYNIVYQNILRIV